MARLPGLLLLLLILGSAAGGAERPDMIPDWDDLPYEPYPLDDAPGIVNPILTYLDTEPGITFVADPFLFREEGHWYLFFEAYRVGPGGRIALASSEDGLSWQYEGFVLEEPEQMSHPLVFQWDGNYYLVPSIYPLEAVRLYWAKPEDFPYQWTPVAELVSGRLFADATLFRHEDLWWMFVANTQGNICWLYFSDSLEDPAAWTEHPASPIVADDRRKARPGGRVVVLEEDRIFRPAQKSYPIYGEMLRLFEVTKLTTKTYAEHEVEASPILKPSGEGWNAERMHHYDPWWTGDRWLVAVDGHDGYRWSIGLYASESILTAMQAGADAVPAFGLSGSSNPFRPGARLRFQLPTRARALLTIHDVSGRELACLLDSERDAGRQGLRWNGRDAEGRPLASGVYLARLRSGGRAATRKLVLLR